MTYRELLGKEIFLCGTRRRCADIQEFFHELTIGRTMLLEREDELPDDRQELLLQTYSSPKRQEELMVIGETRSEKLSAALEKARLAHREDYIWLEDLLEVTNEPETFYIDKMKGDRKIALYGTGDLTAELMERNPHLRVDYFLTQDGGEPAVPCRAVITMEGLEDIRDENLFVILAAEVDLQVKNLFETRGFVFGRDFHFYNPAAFKRPVSHYLKKALYAPPKYILPCNYTTRALSIKNHGNVMACCSACLLTLGNCTYTSMEEIVSGIEAQLVNLSVNNRTYCFCGDMCFMFREKAYCLEDEGRVSGNERRHDPVHKIADFIVQLGYDRSCNLACPSCRTHRITEPEDKPAVMEMIHTEVKRMCLLKPRNVRIGNGELFFSKFYKDIIFHCYESKAISLISNGILFNQENWAQLEDRYERVTLEVSMDATRKETYKKLRGGNFDILLRNMEFAGRLRQENKLVKLSVSFVVQAENFMEMVEFVEYGNKIHADHIHFIKLNSWGHIPKEEFIKMDVYDPRNSNHGKFVELLHHPVFQSPNVHVDNIHNFI